MFLWLTTGLVAVFVFNFHNAWVINLSFQGVLLVYIALAAISKRWRKYIYSESTFFKKKIK
jgi:hypothetical protein